MCNCKNHKHGQRKATCNCCSNLGRTRQETPYKYIVVVASGDEGVVNIDHVRSFRERVPAEEYANQEAKDFDLDFNIGAVKVFELEPDGRMSEVYSPEIQEREEEDEA